MMPAAHVHSKMTTEEEILADSDLMDQLRESEEDIKAGRVYD